MLAWATEGCQQFWSKMIIISAADLPEQLEEGGISGRICSFQHHSPKCI